MNPGRIVVEERKHTLIVARRVLTGPKIALAGAIFELFSARFKTSMAAFNAEVALSCSFGRWGFASIVEGRDEVWRKGCEEGSELYRDERPFRRDRSASALVQKNPYGAFAFTCSLSVGGRNRE